LSSLIFSVNIKYSACCNDLGLFPPYTLFYRGGNITTDFPYLCASFRPGQLAMETGGGSVFICTGGRNSACANENGYLGVAKRQKLNGMSCGQKKAQYAYPLSRLPALTEILNRGPGMA
jgi:hypothetical protein